MRPEGVAQPVAPGPPLRGAAREAAGRALSAERGGAAGASGAVRGRAAGPRSPPALVGALRGSGALRSSGSSSCCLLLLRNLFVGRRWDLAGGGGSRGVNVPRVADR